MLKILRLEEITFITEMISEKYDIWINTHVQNSRMHVIYFKIFEIKKKAGCSRSCL